MARIESLSSTNATATLAYLSRSPYEHVFLSYIVREGTPAMQRGIRTSFDSTGNVNGVAYFGHQIVLASEEAALAGFAQTAKRYPGEHAIVGPRAGTDMQRSYATEARTRPAVSHGDRRQQPASSEFRHGPRSPGTRRRVGGCG